MTRKKYPEWQPDDLTAGPHDPGEDQLSAQVGARGDERVVADPEIDAPAKIVHVQNTTPPQPRPAEIQREVFDPSAPPVVERIDLDAHLRPRPASNDRFACGQSQAIVVPIGEEDGR